jgi:hypothetical protein
MRAALAIGCAIAGGLFAFLFVSYLPNAERVEDLSEHGAGLELGEWRANAGILFLATISFAVLAVWLGGVSLRALVQNNSRREQTPSKRPQVQQDLP